MEQDTNFQYFRALLAFGALVSLGAGVTGLLAPSVLDSWLGLEGEPDGEAFTAVARLFGAVCLTLGLGYVLAAADPSRQRSLLAVLFCGPVAGLVGLVAATIGGDMSAVRGWVLAVFALAYTLVYVRLYPQARRPAAQQT